MSAVPQHKQISRVTEDDKNHSPVVPSVETTTSASTEISSDSGYDESTTTFTSASSADGDARGLPARVSAPPAAPAVSQPHTHVGHAGGGRVMQLNPELHFNQPDNEYIPLPRAPGAPQMSSLLRCIFIDRTSYPEGSYRMVDYFRAAVVMFVHQVRLEYKQQVEFARRNGKPMTRFTWKNKGDLAIYFACCCDMLKLLYDIIQPGSMSISWNTFVQQLAPLLIAESRLPSTVLTEQTYHIKYMDWQKGGTRYGGENFTANIRFPSAQERRVLIETYLRFGTGCKIEAVSVDPASVLHLAPVSLATRPPSANGPVTAVVPPGTRMEIKTVLQHPSRVAPPPFIPPVAPSAKPEGPGPVRALPRTLPKGGGPHPPALVAVKQMPEEMRHLYWLSALAHVKGGAPGAAFPDERAAAMPGFVRLCEMTKSVREIRVLADVMATSSEGIQTVFERLGGMVLLRRFVNAFVREGDDVSLIHFVRQVVQFKGPPLWSILSQKSWMTDNTGKLANDLTWLRELPMIPAEKRAAWGALVLVMEEKYIFKAAREEVEEVRKRKRADEPLGITASPTSSALRAALSDNCDFQRWKLPRVNSLAAVRLPVELRTPPFSSELEQDSIDFINAKSQYAKSAQEEWRSRILAALRVKRVEENCVTVPLWYDPFQLLGITQLGQ